MTKLLPPPLLFEPVELDLAGVAFLGFSCLPSCLNLHSSPLLHHPCSQNLQTLDLSPLPGRGCGTSWSNLHWSSLHPSRFHVIQNLFGMYCFFSAPRAGVDARAFPARFVPNERFSNPSSARRYSFKSPVNDWTVLDVHKFILYAPGRPFGICFRGTPESSAVRTLRPWWFSCSPRNA